MKNWQNNYNFAALSTLTVKDGFVTALSVADSYSPALGYSVDLKKGDLLIIETNIENTQSKVFIDIADHSLPDQKESALITNR